MESMLSTFQNLVDFDDPVAVSMYVLFGTSATETTRLVQPTL